MYPRRGPFATGSRLPLACKRANHRSSSAPCARSAHTKMWPHAVPCPQNRQAVGGIARCIGMTAFSLPQGANCVNHGQHTPWPCARICAACPLRSHYPSAQTAEPRQSESVHVRAPSLLVSQHRGSLDLYRSAVDRRGPSLCSGLAPLAPTTGW